jgi:imidazole glycerol phosphate synthase subunit HisF
MATTSNYGWTTPDDSSLVKDGASAIRTLGSAIDTSLNTALGTKKAGMVLLNTTSFSAVATQSINNVFTSTYDNYLINVTISGSVNDNENTFRFRASGTDNTSANYQSTFCGAFNSAGNFNSQTGATSILGIPANGQTGTFNAWTIHVYRPNSTDAWKQVTAVGGYKHSSVNTITRTISGYLNSTTQFDGFTFLAASGNITGTLRVYGYNN